MKRLLGGALAIEADGGITTYGDILVIGDIVRCSGSQSGKLEQARAVDGEVRYLLAGDQIADFPGIGLYGNRIGFYGYQLGRLADLHLEVHAVAVAYTQHHKPVLWAGLNPDTLTSTV